MKIAPLWRRCLSRLIDIATLALLMAGGIFVLHKINAQKFEITDALIFFVALAYEVCIPFATRGSSLGRFLTQIRLHSETVNYYPSLIQYVARFGTRVAMFAALVVFIAYEVELPVVLLVCIVEAAILAFTVRRQTIGDLVARTVVIVPGAQ